jgi:hypothetical protein
MRDPLHDHLTPLFVEAIANAVRRASGSQRGSRHGRTSDTEQKAKACAGWPGGASVERRTSLGHPRWATRPKFHETDFV